MKRLFFLLPWVFSAMMLQGADYYWVNGTGNWSDFAGHWATTSGGTTFHTMAPGPNDNVHFDINSFTAVGQTVNVNVNPGSCLNMDWTGVINTPTLSISATGALDVYGDLTLVANMQLVFVSQFASRIRMQADDAGHTITTAGRNMVNFRIEGSGEWTLQDALSSSSEFIVSGGTFISDGFAINASTFSINGIGVNMDLSNSTIAASTFRITSSASVLLTGSDLTATQVSVFSSGIVFNSVELVGSTPSLSGSNLIFGSLLLSGTTRTEVNGSHTINTILSATQAGTLIEISGGSTITLNGSIQSLGAGCDELITWRSDDPGTALTISKSSGSVLLDYVILQDIHGSGGATFVADNSLGLGNTNGWTINAPLPQTYYWIADGGGNWSDSNNWATTSGGTSNGCIPTPADDVVFDFNSFNTAVAQPTVTVDDGLQQAASMTWTGVINNPKLLIPTLTRLELYGDLILTAGMETEFSSGPSSQILMKASGPTTIQSAGKDLVNLRLDGAGATFTLNDALTSSYELFILGGLLDLDENDLNGNIILVNGSGAALDMTNAQVTAALRFNASTFSGLSAAGSTLTTNQLSVLPAAAVLNSVIINGTSGAISGSGITMSDLTISSSGTTTMSGNHIINGLLLLDNPGGILSVQAGAVISIGDFDSNAGSCGNEIYLRSNAAGVVFTFSFTGGTPPPAADNTNLIIQDSQVDNGPFTVDASFGLGIISGWVINAPAPQQYYWIGGSGNWSDASHWSLTSGGETAKCLPSVNDDVIFDHLSFTAGSQQVTVPSGNFYCRNMEWINSGPNAVANQPTLYIGNVGNLYVHGSLLMANSSQMNFQAAGLFASKIFMAAGAGGNQIRSGGLDLVNLRLDGDGGTWTLLDDLTVSSEFFLTNGTLQTDGFNISGGTFSMNSGTALTLADSRLAFANTRWSSNAVDAGTSTVVTNNFSTFTSGLTLHDVQLTQAGARLSASSLVVNNFQLAAPDQTTVTGNITVQGDLEFDYPGSIVALGAGNTVEVSGEIINNALPAQRITLRSSTTGVQALLRKTGGKVCLENLNIRDSNAGGGAVFGAVNSSDQGNNSGWEFSADVSCAIYLPVECADFRGELVSEGVQLQWTTWTEQDNSGFQIQRSAEDGVFITIAWMDGAGDSDQSLTYRFLDNTLPALTGGTYYYRLMQIDHDAQTQQACNVVSVQLEERETAILRVYPNPASHTATLAWTQPADGLVTYTVYDALGRPWLNRSVERMAGPQSRELDVSDWPLGVHTVRLQMSDGMVRVVRLVVE